MRYLFILSEVVIYLSFLILDVFYNSYEKAANIKFFGILLCSAYMLYQLISDVIKRKGNKSDKSNKRNISLYRDRAVMMTALSFTLLADTQLLYDGNFFIGICIFIFVQLLYLYRISYRYKILVRTVIRVITVRLYIVGVLLIIIVRAFSYDRIIILVCIYITFFVGNICLLIKQMKSKNNRGYNKFKNNRRGRKYKNRILVQYNIQDTFFLVGMLLFLLCDINVGIFNISTFITFSSSYIHRLIDYSSILMWFFYLPSQVLITLSADTICTL